MKRYVALVILLIAFAGSLGGQQISPFRLEMAQASFEQMRSTPGFDVSKPLQWGFFFIASSPASLQTIRAQLERNGYAYVEEHKDEMGKFWLQLAKVEIHTPESLHRRNQELFAFAAQYQGVIYDGWDVTRQK